MEEVDATKPRRGRRAHTTGPAPLPDTEPELEPKPAAARPRRGRRPNPENLRSAVLPESTSETSLLDLLSTSLEDLEPSPKPPRSLPAPASPNLGRRHDFDETPCRSSPSLAIGDANGFQLAQPTTLILAELDEIEIPRAGRNSDSDVDSSKPSSAAPRRKTTSRKTVTTRKKTSKKAPTTGGGEEEEAELPRASRSSASVDKTQTKTKTSRNPQPATIISDQAPGSQSLMTGQFFKKLIKK